MTRSANMISEMIDERAGEGLFRIRRSMFTDPEIFELEMRHIFEANWVFVGHEAQIPNPYDFMTTKIGRVPVIINRLGDGKIGGLLNTCAHRGATLEQIRCGNRRQFSCPFHAWTYAADGKLLGCGDTEKAGYGAGFRKSDHNATKIARIETYRGFIFASLSPNVTTLEEYLGEARTFIDLIVDQDPNGELEIVPGPQTYVFDGNWKLQSENGVDGYHIGTIHGNYVLTTNNRQKLDGESARVKPMDVSKFSAFPGGYYAFENGHVLLWNESPNPQIRPSFDNREQIKQRWGKDRAWWMNNCWRNLFLYPNVFLMDQMSTQIRIIYPISVDRTEIRTFCFAPKSDNRQQRIQRIRQYEDFFNASGMATPDDLAAFNASQRGFHAEMVEWSDVSRGARHMIEGADEHARALGFTPAYHGTRLEDEGIYLNQHRRWRDLLIAGCEAEDSLKRHSNHA
jgi:benzoate/toluate 1,2-dioxygenase alpha subunit